MSKIKILSPDVVAKIAAGEVVERPASVVKELVENSIDALSNQITVKINDSGLELIEVIDNGKGMSQDDARIAFTQHSTSKIFSADDLNAITTLGFRGEALSSIASVADIIMKTNQKKESSELTILNGKEEFTVSKAEKGSAGTIISVKELFKRIPARKKFLRSQATEFKQIADIFIKHALARPDIHFNLIHNGKEIYNLPKLQLNDIKTRIFDIWGKKIADKLIPVTFNGPEMQVAGAIGHPELTRRDKSMQFTFLNSRPVNSSLVSKAVEEAFHATKPIEFQPIFFLNLVISPQNIDVNVHPRKLEIKFNDTRSVFVNVKRAVEKALNDFLSTSVKRTFEFEYKPKITTYKDNTLKDRSTTYGKHLHSNTNVINKSLQFSAELFRPVKSDGVPKTISDIKFAQFFNTFIIIEKSNELLFIDQHAADERIKYEKIMKNIKKKENIVIQHLLVPQTIELSHADFEIFKENTEVFRNIGLELEPFGKNTLKLSAIPKVLGDFDINSFIQEILERELTDFDQKEVLHTIVASMACHGSIRAGKKMHKEEIEAMIQQLFECEKPYSCPHGRPIIWEMSRYEVEKRFKRTGFC